MSYRFEPSHCLVIINAWPDHRVQREMDYWLGHTGIGPRQILTHTHGDPNHGGMVAAYNMAVRLALQSTADQFIIADNDAKPAPDITRPFLAADADVVSAECRTGGHGDAFSGPEAFHTILWRCSRQVLEAMRPPYFEWPWSPDYADVTGCLCEVFRDKALRLGFSVAHAGNVGHEPGRSPSEPRILTLGPQACMFFPKDDAT